MGALPFLTSLFGTAIALLLPALLASATIAFFLPFRPAKAARTFVEWATALSGAGYVAVALTWMSFTFSDRLNSVPPAIFGSAVAISYLPLYIVLFLRALEQRWPVLLAGRAIGLSATQVAAAISRSAARECIDAIGLLFARLLSDGAVLICIFWPQENGVLLALPIMALAIMLFSRRLLRLAQATGMPVYPPLFVPLPELPPRLRMAPRVSAFGRLALQLSLATLVIFAAFEMSGLGILRNWAAVGALAQPATQHYQRAVPALGVALQGVAPILIAAGLGIWLWMEHVQRNWRHSISVALAAISPIAFAYPAVLFLRSEWFVWLLLATGGLSAYVIIQVNAARYVHNLTARATLSPGENTSAAAVQTLGLSASLQTYKMPAAGESLSAAATWFSAAALLAAAYGIASPYPAACALVWSVLAAILQLAAVWQQSNQPRLLVCHSPVSATLEALSHDTA